MPATDPKKLRYVTLCWGATLGPATFKRLLDHFGTVEQVLSAHPDDLPRSSARLSPEQIAVIPTLGQRLSEFATELQELHRENIHVFCDWEDDYPGLFLAIRNPPPVICVAGRIMPQDDPAIAIVGTRTPTPEGYEMARSLGRAFAETGTTVVSGLALGCDTAAHTGALEANGRTIAVFGSGIRVVHPRRNLDLAREIFRQGAVVSEQPPSARPTKGTFMARNRLQSALSRAVLVVESGEQGGSMETARHAAAQARCLYAVRWPASGEYSKGPEKLMSEGARPVSGLEDVPAIRESLVDHIGRMQECSPRPNGQGTLFDT